MAHSADSVESQKCQLRFRRYRILYFVFAKIAKARNWITTNERVVARNIVKLSLRSRLKFSYWEILESWNRTSNVSIIMKMIFQAQFWYGQLWTFHTESPTTPKCKIFRILPWQFKSRLTSLPLSAISTASHIYIYARFKIKWEIQLKWKHFLSWIIFFKDKR